MARPKKIGLSYFPLDCQMDDKIEMLEAEHELIGFAVYIKLLQSIYQTEDGELDMSIVFRWKTLGKTYGIPTENLRNMVSTMLEVGLFCKKCFDERRVLTSNGIKKRIGQVSELRFKERKRKEKPVEGSFPPGKPENSDRKSTQKEKEKEKETSFKEENKASPSTPTENQNPELPFELEPLEPKKPKEKSSAKKEKVPRPWADQISFEGKDTPELRAKWQEWIEYKFNPANKKSPYTTLRGEQAQLDEIGRFATPFALWAIDNAIDKEWQGIVNDSTRREYERYGKNPAAFMESKGRTTLSITKSAPEKGTPEYYEQLKKQYAFSKTA